jgi:hypothetical protein
MTLKLNMKKQLFLLLTASSFVTSVQASTVTNQIECNGTFSSVGNGWSYKSQCTVSENPNPKSIIQVRDEFEDKPVMYRLDIRDDTGSKYSSIHFKCDASTDNYTFKAYASGGEIKVRFDDEKAYDVKLIDLREQAMWMATKGRKGVDYSYFNENEVTRFIDDISESKIMRTKTSLASTYKYNLSDYNDKMISFINLCHEMKDNMK